MPTDNTAVVGPCECGGYGVVLDEESKARFGACHLTEDPVCVLRLDTDPVRIRVERRRDGGWSAVVFDNIGGPLAGGTHTGRTQGEATGRATEAARALGRQTLHVEWEADHAS